MRACAIVNPVAGQGRGARLWPALRDRLQTVVTALTVHRTQAPGQATTLTRTALKRSYDRILAIGGDGTLHEVVNGYFRPDGSPLRPAPPLVPFLCGTGEDFARALGGRGLGALRFLREGRVRPVDLLRVTHTNGDGERARTYAVNIVSFGLSGEVVRMMQRGCVSLPGGRLRYLGAILRVLPCHRPARVELSLDGSTLGRPRVRLVAVANGSAFAGGLRIAPSAEIDDESLDVTLLRDVPLLRLLWATPRFYTGTHLSLTGVTAHRGRCLTARPVEEEPVWLEADGELLGQLPATVEVVPKALPMQY